jgi:RNA binding exosome subunit
MKLHYKYHLYTLEYGKWRQATMRREIRKKRRVEKIPTERAKKCANLVKGARYDTRKFYVRVEKQHAEATSGALWRRARKREIACGPWRGM